jgi:hypothetical protein
MVRWASEPPMKSNLDECSDQKTEMGTLLGLDYFGSGGVGNASKPFCEIGQVYPPREMVSALKRRRPLRFPSRYREPVSALAFDI